MEIRQLDPGQMLDAVQVIRQSFRTVADAFGLTSENCPSHPAFLAEEQLRAQVAGGLRLFGYYAGDVLAGVVGIAPMNLREFSIEKLAVLPAYRHRRIGAKLMIFACEQIVREGGEKACIGIVDENTVLKQWYAGQGFTATEIKRFPHLPFTVCFMEKLVKRTSETGMAFVPLREEDFPLIHRWMNQPFVYEWYGKHPPTMQEVRDKHLPYIKGSKPTVGFLIHIDAQPVGYVQTYLMDNYPEYNAQIGHPDQAAMFDIFIGEFAFLHKGYGSVIMKQFLDEIVFTLYPVNTCLIGPEPENAVAIRAYEKAGFRYYRTITQDDGAREYIMKVQRSG